MSDLITHEGSFEWAMLQLKEGKRVARKGWNGKGMYLLRNPGLVGQTVQEGDYRAQAGVEVGKAFDFLPNIEMCNADGNFVPWVSSQADVAAGDWILMSDSEYMLVFDMTSGVNSNNIRGYALNNFGECNLIEDKFGIDYISQFSYRGEYKRLNFRIYCSEYLAERFTASLNKAKLEVTVNDKAFLLARDSSGWFSGYFHLGYDASPEFASIISTLGVRQRYHINWVL